MLKGIKEARISAKCTKICVPVTYSAFFNKSQIEICSSFDEHFCGILETWVFITNQITFCRQLEEQKYFKGMVDFREGFSNLYPSVMNEERKKRTLMLLYWNPQSNLTTISEEKLVYGSRDLLALLGGALGIFVGYSFLDLVKHIIDVAFYFLYRFISKQ